MKQWHLVSNTTNQILFSHDHFNKVMAKLAKEDGEWTVHWDSKCIVKGLYHIACFDQSEITEV